MDKEVKILVIDNNTSYARLLKRELKVGGYNDVNVFKSGKECMDNLASGIDIIILDYFLEDTFGACLMKEVKKVSPLTKVIFFSSQTRVGVALFAMKLGAFAYVEKKPKSFKRVRALVNRVQKHNQKQKEINQIRILKHLTLLFFISLSIYLAFLTH